MGALIFLFAIAIFMLWIVFQGAESKTKATVATAATMFGVLAFVLVIETNLYLFCQILDSVFSFFAMAFVTVMEFIVTTMQLAIVAFFEGFIWLLVVVAEAVAWVFWNSIWLFGQAPFTCSMAFAMLCVWGASGE